MILALALGSVQSEGLSCRDGISDSIRLAGDGVPGLFGPEATHGGRTCVCSLGKQSRREEKAAYGSPFHPGKVKVGRFSPSKAFSSQVKSFQFSLSLCRATNPLLCRGHSQEGHQLPAKPTTRREVLPHRPWQVCWMEHPYGYPPSILKLARAT